MATIYQKVKLRVLTDTSTENDTYTYGAGVVIALSYKERTSGSNEYDLISYLYDVTEDGKSYKEIPAMRYGMSLYQFAGYPWQNLCCTIPGRLFNDNNQHKLDDAQNIFMNVDISDEYKKQVQAHPGQDVIKLLSKEDIVDLTEKVDWTKKSQITPTDTIDENGVTGQVTLKVPTNSILVYSPAFRQKKNPSTTFQMNKTRTIKFLKAGKAQ